MNALTVVVPPGLSASVRLPPCHSWQWGAYQLIAGAQAELRIIGPGFDSTAFAPLQTIGTPSGLSIVNTYFGPDVYLVFSANTGGCQVVIFHDSWRPYGE
jgi:hypothetical protein